jgi:hypothetical protein
LQPGCQIFLGAKYQNGKNITNNHKIYQMSIKCTKWPQNIPNGRQIDQTAIKYIHQMAVQYRYLPTSSIARPPKCTRNGIFGLRICNLATLSRKRSFAATAAAASLAQIPQFSAKFQKLLNYSRAA